MDTKFLQYSAAAFLSTALPRRLAYRAGCRTADGFYRRDVRGRKAVEANLRTIFRFKGQSLERGEMDRQVRETFRQFGKYLVDFFRYTGLSRRRAKRLIDIESREHLEGAAALGKGVILVTAHLGSWELGGAFIAGMGYPVNAVVLPENNKRTNAMFQRYRERRGLKVIPLGCAARALLGALRRGEAVVLMADRDYTARSDFVEFFGRKVRLPTGPARLSVKTGAPVVPAFLLRLKGDRFLLRFYPRIEPDGPASADHVRDRIREVLQGEIGENPNQWFMFDDFWSGRNNHAAHLSSGGENE